MGRYRKPYTLFKRGDYWYFRTYGRDGRRTTARTTGQKTKKLAAEWCEELLKVDRLGFSRQTFRDYAKDFYDDDSVFITDRPTPIAPSTIRIYRSTLERFIMPYFGEVKLSDINYTMVKTFRQKLLKDGYSHNHINNIFTSFKQIMNFAYRDDLIHKNPLEGIAFLERPANAKDSFTREEVKRIYSDVLPELKSFVLLLAITGTRFSEAYGLTSEDIRTKDGTYYFELNKQMIEDGVYSPLKTKDSRVIPIPEEFALNFKRTESSRSHIKLHTRKVIRTLDSWEKRGLSLHSMRHFFITDTKAKKINPLIVETVAGHKLKGIANIYTNFHIEDLKELIAWQEDLINYLEDKK